MKLAISLFLFSLCILLFTFLIVNYETKEIFASVSVSERLGFDLNDSTLNFGTITPLSSSSRKLVFENPYDFPVLLDISSKGTISDILSYDNKIRVESNEKKKISFTVNSREEFQDYSGVVKVRIIPLKN